MKITVDIDCTPKEARAFLGLPDVEALNDLVVEQMQKKLTENMHALQPEELMRSWAGFGMQAQEQFARMMQMAGTTHKAP